MSPDRENRLIERLKSRDETAFNEIVGLYQSRVYNLVYRMLGSREEAQDVAQEVFITVFKAIHLFRGESKFSTWLYRIATNHCKNRLKYLGRRAVYPKTPLDDLSERDQLESASMSTSGTVDRPDRLLEGVEVERLLQEAMVELDEDHRLLIVLRDIQNLSYQEIAEITQLAEGTVKSRLHRARAALRERLVEKGALE
ncbi:MAG: sigma-70 family RNA polymerase sigma factor [Deltaproteobacteria bacterium]|nr:sigma-70 family RNA polymerase sigma factor [Deltaproteobacteria bacterium]